MTVIVRLTDAPGGIRSVRRIDTALLRRGSARSSLENTAAKKNIAHTTASEIYRSICITIVPDVTCMF